jgi:hypothetical protein
MRIACGVASVMLGGLLAVYPFTLARPHPLLVAAVVVAAAAMALAFLAGWSQAVGAAAALLGAQYLAALIAAHHGIDGLVPAYALVWFFFIELADISTTWPGPLKLERAVLVARGRFCLNVGAGIVVFGGLAVLVVDSSGGGLALLVIGALAAVAALALPLFFALPRALSR